jgi:hypothetical protein
VQVFAIPITNFLEGKFLTIDILTPFMFVPAAQRNFVVSFPCFNTFLMYAFVCSNNTAVPSPSCRSSQSSVIQDFVDDQTNFPVPQSSSYRVVVRVTARTTYYLFLALVGPPPPPPSGLLRVNLDMVYGDIPTLCPQNLQLSSATGTLQLLGKLKSDNARCSWFYTAPLANRVFFSVTLRPNSCTAIDIMSPSSGEKWTLNADPAGPWPVNFINSSVPLNQRNNNANIVPLTFANWEGNAVITAYNPSRWSSCQNSDTEKIQVSWQTLYAEDDSAFVQTPQNQIILGSNGVYNLTARMLNVPPLATNTSGRQFERNLWLKMSAGQTVTIIAKDTNTGSSLNRLSSAPIPLIMVASSRIPTTFDNDFHNWPGILSPVRAQLQESITITAPNDGTYYVSILGGTILYDAVETIDIFVVQGTGSYDNCWDDKMTVIKPRDVCVVRNPCTFVLRLELR